MDAPSLSRLSLRQSLAFWTLVPMTAFSLIVVLLAFGWAWRNVQIVAAERNASLAYVTALAIHERIVGAGAQEEPICAAIGDLATAADRTWYLVNTDQEIVCASPEARFRPGQIIGYDLDESVAALGVADLRSRRYSASYVLIPDTPWGLVLEESRDSMLSPTYALVMALSALTIVGLVLAFWLLFLGFNRISWPLQAVTEQAQRVAAGETFDPPDVDGPVEVEALVAAFNRMVTELGEQRDRLQEYATRMLNSQEEERRRISRDLHDETAQELVGLIQRIDLGRLAAEDDPQMMSALDELGELANRTLAGVRRTSQALRPLILEDLGLVAAVQAVVEELGTELGEGQAFCEVIGEEQRLSPEVELTAFRIVQEALTNVRKHAADATRVYVTVQFLRDHLHVSVEDNGCGFRLLPRTGWTNREQLGLMGMRERAELLDGTWTIDSRPGEGTRVTLELPTHIA